MKTIFLCIGIASLVFYGCSNSELPENYGKVSTQLYLSEGKNQPLIVGLGGSEGGNIWTSDYWKSTREKLQSSGYALLALEYFGGKNTPKQLDRIAIDSVYAKIIEATQHPDINPKKIILIGGSKGAELALLLASKYPNISGVVSIVGPHSTFPALTLMATTSSWTYQGKEVNFIPLPWAATPALIKNDLREAFTIMLQDSTAVEQATIDVNSIQGPVLLVSATNDELWPSTEMSSEIMKAFKRSQFEYYNQHIIIEGGHKSPLAHFDTIIHIVNTHF